MYKPKKIIPPTCRQVSFVEIITELIVVEIIQLFLGIRKADAVETIANLRKNIERKEIDAFKIEEIKDRIHRINRIIDRVIDIHRDIGGNTIHIPRYIYNIITKELDCRHCNNKEKCSYNDSTIEVECECTDNYTSVLTFKKDKDFYCSDYSITKDLNTMIDDSLPGDLVEYKKNIFVATIERIINDIMYKYWPGLNFKAIHIIEKLPIEERLTATMVVLKKLENDHTNFLERMPSLNLFTDSSSISKSSKEFKKDIEDNIKFSFRCTKCMFFNRNNCFIKNSFEEKFCENCKSVIKSINKDIVTVVPCRQFTLVTL